MSYILVDYVHGSGGNFIADMIAVAMGQQRTVNKDGSCHEYDETKKKLYTYDKVFPKNFRKYNFIISTEGLDYSLDICARHGIDEKDIKIVQILPPWDPESILERNIKSFVKNYIPNSLIDGSWERDRPVLETKYRQKFNNPPAEFTTDEYIKFLHHWHRMPSRNQCKICTSKNAYTINFHDVFHSDNELRLLIEWLGLEMTDAVRSFIRSYRENQPIMYMGLRNYEILAKFREINLTTPIICAYASGSGGTTLGTALGLLMYDQPQYIEFREIGDTIETIVSPGWEMNKECRMINKVNGYFSHDLDFILADIARDYYKIHLTHYEKPAEILEQLPKCKMIVIKNDMTSVARANTLYKNEGNFEEARKVYETKEFHYNKIEVPPENERVLVIPFSKLFDADYVVDELIDFFELTPKESTIQMTLEFLERWIDGQIFT